ncbi:MAG: YggT family protein [Actinomycetia bacterium]|nr:YggT family protein [Actinomycetes bacterium]
MPIIELVDTAFQIYSFLILARIIMSWITVPDTPPLDVVVRFINDVTEPYLGVFRRLLPMVGLGGSAIDFSPIIAFFVLGLIRGLVLQALSQIL